MADINIDDIINVSGAEGNLDKVIAKINELDRVIIDLNKRQINIGNIGSIKELQVQTDAVNEKMATYNKTMADTIKIQAESAKSTKVAVDAYGLLKSELAEAERFAKNMAAIYGVQSKQALEAANAAKVLRDRLIEVNNVTKDTSKADKSAEIKSAKDLAQAEAIRTKSLIEQERELERLIALEEKDNAAKAKAAAQDPNNVPFTSNLSELEAERAALSQTGTVVSELEIQQAAAANEATAFAVAQSEAGKVVAASAADIEAIVIPLQEYTGTLQANIQQGVQYKARLAEISAELKAGSGDTLALTEEQASLKVALSETTSTITAQTKYLQAADGSFDQLNARVALSKNLLRQLSAEEKASAFGTQLAADIKILDAALKSEAAQMGDHQKNVGNYTGALGGLYGAVRKIAQIVPGLGIAGVFALAIDPISKAAKELFNYESSEDKAKRTTAALTDELKFQNDALKINADQIKANTDAVVASLKQKGASANEVTQAVRQGLVEQGKNEQQAAKQTVDLLNKQISTIGELQAKVKAVGSLSGDLQGLTKFNVAKLSSEDATDIVKIQGFLHGIATFKTSKDFANIPEDVKALITNLDLVGNKLLQNATNSKSFITQAAQTTNDFTAQVAEANRVASKEAIESAISTQADINERNHKAQLDQLAFTDAVRKKDFAALKAQVIAERDYQLSAENDKIQKINAIRSVELLQPGLSDAQKSKINSDADAQVSAARLTEAQREVIIKAANAKLLDIQKDYDLRQAQAEAQLFEQQKQFQSSIYDQESKELELSLTDRLAAITEFSAAQRAILDKARQLQLTQDSYLTLTPEEKLQKEKEYETKLLQLNIDLQKRITENIRSEIDKQQELRAESLDEITRLYSRIDLSASTQYSKDVIALNDSLAAKKISLVAYNEERKRIDNNYSLDELQNIEKQLQAELLLYKNADANLLAEEIRLHDLQAKLATATTPEEKNRLSEEIVTQKKVVLVAKDTVDKRIKGEKDITENQKQQSEKRRTNTNEETQERIKKFQEVVDAYSAILDQVTAFGDAGFDTRIGKIEDEKDALAERYQLEIDGINQSGLAQVDKQKKLDEASKRNQAQQRILDQQEKAEKIKKAEFEKEQAIFSIILSTAKAIAGDLGNPFKIIVDAALGAAQLAVAIATPLPRFFKGKNIGDNYEGYGWVDDGGRAELIERADGRLEVGTNQPRVTYLGKNDIVYPDAKTELIRRSMVNSQMALSKATVIENNDFNKLSKDIMQSGKNIVKAIKGQPQPKNGMNRNDIIMHAWLSGNKSWRDFLNN